MAKPVFFAFTDEETDQLPPGMACVFYRLDEIKAFLYDGVFDFPEQAYRALCSDGVWRTFYDTNEVKRFLMHVDAAMDEDHVDQTIKEAEAKEWWKEDETK